MMAKRALFAFAVCAAVSAAPALRLSNTVVVAQTAIGASPPSEVVYVENAGDGQLSLSFSIPTDAPWVAAAYEPSLPYLKESGIRFDFATTQLPAGVYTTVVTVSDPGAVDAPQFITVTVWVAQTPAGAEQYVARGGSWNGYNFPPGGNAYDPGTTCHGNVSTQDGAMWLSIVEDGFGTIQLLSVCTIEMTPIPNMATGIYHGTLNPSASSPVPVTMHLVEPPPSPDGPPLVFFNSGVDIATFKSGIDPAPGELMAAFGQNLARSETWSDSGGGLPTLLGGVNVLVNGSPAPLFHVAPDRVEFQLPSDVMLGAAKVQVVREAVPGNTISLGVASISPRIAAVTDTAFNLIDATHPLRAGGPFIIWAIGLGATLPPVADGAPAPLNPVAITRQSFTLNTPWGAQTGLSGALSPGSIGLYQILADAPASFKGLANISLSYGQYVPILIQ